MPNPSSLSNDNLRSLLHNLQQNLSQQENEAAAEIKNLISTIDRLFTRDSSGQLPVLQGETLETIKNDYKSAFNSVQSVLQQSRSINNINNVNNPKDEENPADSVWKQIDEYLRADILALNHILPNENVNLFQTLDRARTRKVSMSKQQARSVGGMVSSRIPLSIPENDGSSTDGFFTRESRVDTLQLLTTFLRDETEKEKEALRLSGKDLSDAVIGPMLNDLWEKYRKNKETEYLNAQKDYSDSYAAQDFFRDIYTRITAMKSSSKENHVVLGKRNTGIALKEMCRESFPEKFKETNLEEKLAKTIRDSKLYTDVMLTHTYITRLQTTEGANIDKRNVAMYDVARLLGVPEVICKSQSMELTVGGETFKGTFMAKASGLDPMNLPSRHPAFRKGFANQSAIGLKNVMDLQIIDFICGNIDRHAGNMFYRYDDDGNFIGVQGIDNDLSFGNNTFQDNKNVKYLKSAANIPCISESMATRIVSINSDMLKLALADKDLPATEIEAACSRLAQIREKTLTELQRQQRVRDANVQGKNPDPKDLSPKLTILSDQTLKNTLLKNYATSEHEKYQKYFEQALDGIDSINKTMQKQELQRKKTAQNNTATEERINTPETVTGLIKEASDTYWALADTIELIPDDPEIGSVLMAMENYLKTAKRYQAKASAPQEKLTARGAAAMSTYLKKLNKAVRTYLESSPEVKNYLDDKTANAEGTIKDRADAILSVTEFCEKQAAILKGIDKELRQDTMQITEKGAQELKGMQELENSRPIREFTETILSPMTQEEITARKNLAPKKRKPLPQNGRNVKFNSLAAIAKARKVKEADVTQTVADSIKDFSSKILAADPKDPAMNLYNSLILDGLMFLEQNKVKLTKTGLKAEDLDQCIEAARRSYKAVGINVMQEMDTHPNSKISRNISFLQDQRSKLRDPNAVVF